GRTVPFDLSKTRKLIRFLLFFLFCRTEHDVIIVGFQECDKPANWFDYVLQYLNGTRISSVAEVETDMVDRRWKSSTPMETEGIATKKQFRFRSVRSETGTGVLDFLQAKKG
ncbi:MAG: hypothetical protein MHM6MM_006234, partial [Cercozoa sp. M6MM]